MINEEMKITTAREVGRVVAIGSDRKMTFHIECQSKPDDTMIVRF